MECFDFTNFPAFAVYVGEEFEGALSSPGPSRHDAFDSVGVHAVTARRDLDAERAAPPRRRATLKGHPGLGVGMLTGLMKRGFDPAFCMDMPKPEHGLGHAFMRPAESLTDMQTPISRSCSTATSRPRSPACAATRWARPCARPSRTTPSDLRVAVVGSGGLWHTPGAQDAYLDEDFDRTDARLHGRRATPRHGRALRRLPHPGGDLASRSRPRGKASPACRARRAPGRHARDLQLDRRRGRSGRQARHRRRLRAGLRLAHRLRLRLLFAEV